MPRSIHLAIDVLIDFFGGKLVRNGMTMTARGPTCRRFSKYLNQISESSDPEGSTLGLRRHQAARLLRMLSLIPWLSIGCVEQPAPAPPVPLPDVVLVTIDTLRADRVG